MNREVLDKRGYVAELIHDLLGHMPRQLIGSLLASCVVWAGFGVVMAVVVFAVVLVARAAGAALLEVWTALESYEGGLD
jgi:hypothetical protein